MSNLLKIAFDDIKHLYRLFIIVEVAVFRNRQTDLFLKYMDDSFLTDRQTGKQPLSFLFVPDGEGGGAGINNKLTIF